MSSIRARIKLDHSGFTTGIRNVRKQSKGMGTSLKGALSGVSGKLAAITAGFVSAAVAVRGFTYGLKTIAEFDQQMANLRSISGGISDEVFGKMEAEARRLGSTTKFTAGQAAEAMFLLKQGGLSAEEAVSGLESTMHLAAAGSLEMGDAAGIAVKQFNIFRDAGVSIEEVGDIMAVTAANAATDVYELSEAMKFSTGIAAMFGHDIKEVSALLGAMASVGQNGEMAGTAVRGLLADLSDRTSQTVRKLENLGVPFREIDPRANSLADVMTRLAGDTKVMANYTSIFQKRVGQGFGAIAMNKDGFIELLDKLKDSKGAMEAMASARMDTLAGDALILKSALEEAFLSTESKNFFRKIVQGMIAAVRKVQEGIKIMRAAFADPRGPDMLRTLLTLAFKSSINFLVKAFAGLAAMIGQLFSENIKNLILGFNVLTTADFWSGMALALTGIAYTFGGALQRIIGETLVRVSEIKGLGWLRGTGDSALGASSDALAIAKEAFSEAGSDLAPAAKLVIERMTEQFRNLGGAYKKGFSSASGPFSTASETAKLADFLADLRFGIKLEAERLASKKGIENGNGNGNGGVGTGNNKSSPGSSAANSVGSVAGAVNAIFNRSINSNLLDSNKRQEAWLKKISDNTKPQDPGPKTLVFPPDHAI